jgi:SAM-dependent methyltransferase
MVLRSSRDFSGGGCGPLTDYSYFDEAYYQDGAKRGTAYRNYLQNAMHVPFFREMAEKVARIFRPARALEIGCATGVAVKHLNDLGVEAHGIDPSEWAVGNRAHPNVILGQAEQLPFPDGHFDVVYSSGSLEHVPPAVRDQAFRELDRVCRHHQFHMVPIVGEGPYRGDDREAIIAGLSHDKTHFNLLERPQWVELFAAVGWRDTGLQVIYAYDSPTFENSWCNLILCRQAPDTELVRAVSVNNVAAAEVLFRARQDVLSRAFLLPEEEAMAFDPMARRITFAGPWRDAIADFEPALDLSGALFRARVQVAGADKPVHLRLGILCGGGEDHVMEHWREYAPGVTELRLTREQFGVLRGNPELSAVTRVVFGGQPGFALVRFSLTALIGDRQIPILTSSNG